MDGFEIIIIGVVVIACAVVAGIMINYTLHPPIYSPAYYTGTVISITGATSYGGAIKFTDGDYWFGNLTMVKNLSINKKCILLENQTGGSDWSNEPGGAFINGTCSK